MNNKDQVGLGTLSERLVGSEIFLVNSAIAPHRAR